jgi:hypothetical protein
LVVVSLRAKQCISLVLIQAQVGEETMGPPKEEKERGGVTDVIGAIVVRRSEFAPRAKK